MTTVFTALRNRLVWLTVALVGLAVVGWLQSDRWLAAAGRWLDVGTTPTPADAALLLPGDNQSRPHGAALLYRKQLVARIVMPRTRSTAANRAGWTRTEDETAIDVLTSQGVPRVAIDVVDGHSDSTWHDAELMAGYAAEHKLRRVIVVTNDFHTRRADWIFRHRFEPLGIDVQTFSVPVERFGPDDWWQRPGGLLPYATEFFKLPFYHLRYGAGLSYGVFLLAAVVLVRYVKQRLRAANQLLDEVLAKVAREEAELPHDGELSNGERFEDEPPEG